MCCDKQKRVLRLELRVTASVVEQTRARAVGAEAKSQPRVGEMHRAARPDEEQLSRHGDTGRAILSLDVCSLPSFAGATRGPWRESRIGHAAAMITHSSTQRLRSATTTIQSNG